MKILEKKVIRDNLFDKSNRQKPDFKKFQTIRSFGDSIYNRVIDPNQVHKKQADLWEYISKFKNQTEKR